MDTQSQGTLFVVATPIGNLDDLSRRAVDTLASVDVVAAEDTRHSRRLLQAYGLERPMVAVHEHNEEAVVPGLVSRLRRGEHIALVSDAGTPLVSDPGYRLVSAAVEAGVPVVPIPGPSAVMAALSVAGLPTDRFVFEGFLAPRRAARQRQLDRLRSETGTLVVFESSHRIEATLRDMADSFGDERYAVLCRELTKRFETILRGTLGQLMRRVAEDSDQTRGEFVVLVAGAQRDSDDRLAAAIELARELRVHLPASKAAQIAARIHDAPRRDVYAVLES
jgi:16S rRNA (cytidine1402-2'-O)-methyltransferase